MYRRSVMGPLLIKGKNVTGFSNEEERLAELDRFVPFLTETELVSRGGIYRKAEKPWASFAVEDTRLVSGQNPASAAAVADLLIAALKRNAYPGVSSDDCLRLLPSVGVRYPEPSLAVTQEYRFIVNSERRVCNGY